MASMNCKSQFWPYRNIFQQQVLLITALIIVPLTAMVVHCFIISTCLFHLWISIHHHSLDIRTLH